MIYGKEDWLEMISARNRGERLQITEEVFDYFLEVLPPVDMGRRITFPDGEIRTVMFEFAEGAEPITAFWREGGAFEDYRRFYCQRTGEVARCR